MSCKRRTRLFKTEYYAYAIRISNYYDQDERQYQNVLLHEMIHYSIAYSGLKDTAPHGVVFRGMMDAFNRKHGWGISVTASVRGVATTDKEDDRKVRERLILAVKMWDGRRFLSVVNPRYARNINSGLKRQSTVRVFGWYVSNDGYFATFPVVRSMRGMIVNENMFDELSVKMRSVSL